MNKIYIMIILFSSSAYSSELIIDQKGLDHEKYSADMYDCQQLTKQVQPEQAEGTMAGDTVRQTAKLAALGATGTAIAGGSGTKGAQVGAGLGVVTGFIGHERREEEKHQNEANETDKVLRNCMTERGYTILN